MIEIICAHLNTDLYTTEESSILMKILYIGKEKSSVWEIIFINAGHFISDYGYTSFVIQYHQCVNHWNPPQVFPDVPIKV